MNNICKQTIQIMEVCGTHTQSISKSGIRYILPNYIKLLSGPGCPVCVTNESYIDMAINLLSHNHIILVTFGDMLKVKGTYLSLADKRLHDNVITVYSPEDAITIAQKRRDKIIVFLAVGFETTAPIIASTINNVYEKGPDNLFFLTSLKRMEPVLRLVLENDQNRIDGLICPGHVAAVLGSNAFRFITDQFRIPAVVCGFETEDIMAGIYILLDQIEMRKPITFINLYHRCVSDTGNKLAQQYMNEVYQIEDGYWRGIGLIPNSALGLRGKFKRLDARNKFGINEKVNYNSSACQCSDIILGMKTPYECMQFGVSCTPENPLGPCMISSEGACSVYYRYRRISFEE